MSRPCWRFNLRQATVIIISVALILSSYQDVGQDTGYLQGIHVLASACWWPALGSVLGFRRWGVLGALGGSALGGMISFWQFTILIYPDFLRLLDIDFVWLTAKSAAGGLVLGLPFSLALFLMYRKAVRRWTAVAISAVLMVAIVIPPLMPAILGIFGAVVAYLRESRSDRFEVVPIAVGFGVGGIIGIMGYEITYRGPWDTGGWVAATPIPVLPATLIVLGSHHARYKSS